MEDVSVRLIDTKALGEHISEYFKKEYVVRGFRGFIESPKMALVDTEIVARNTGEDGTFTISVTDPDIVDADGRRSVCIFPTANTGMSYEELKPFLGDTVPFSKFCEGRRGYNSRLMSNERKVMEWLNS